MRANPARGHTEATAAASAIVGCAALAILLVLAPGARAQLQGVDVQVNEGKAVPSVAQLQEFLNPGDIVRDMLGWHQVDPYCNLAADPDQPLAVPAPMLSLYANVNASLGRNFVTLGFNNKHCGQATNSGSKAFPDTDALRAEFAAYAVRVVETIPALGGVSIWNEMNGSFGGGYGTEAQALTQYCLLANAVIANVRKVDATVPIAIGATVGWEIADWVTGMFDTYGCMGKNDPTILIDVHPYLSGQSFGGHPDWTLWNENIAAIREDGIANLLIATEWGGSAAVKWWTAHPSGNYISTFNAKVMSPDQNWAGLAWFELLASGVHYHAGLLDTTGDLTTFGSEYLAAFKR